MNKILKNMIKGILKHKVQLISLVLLISLGISFFVGVNTSIKSIEKKYDTLLASSNPHQFLLDVKSNVPSNDLVDPTTDQNYTNITTTLESNIKKTYANSIFTLKDIRQIYTNIDSTPQNKSSNSIFKVEEANNSGVDKTVILADDPSQVENGLPKTENDVFISPLYAHARGIKLDDQITIGQSKFKVVGFAVSYDFLFMQLDDLNQVPDGKNQCMVYAKPKAFYQPTNANEAGKKFPTSSSEDREVYLMGTTQNNNFNFNTYFKTNPGGMLYNPKTDTINISGNSLNLYSNNDKDFAFYRRTNTFYPFIKQTKYVLIIVTIILIIVAWFIIVIISKKRLDQDSRFIGVFFANGYRKSEILYCYVGYSIISTFIASVLGLFLSLPIIYFMTYLFWNLFNLPMLNINIFANLGYFFLYFVIAVVAAILIIAMMTLFFLLTKLRNVSTITLINKEI